MAITLKEAFAKNGTPDLTCFTALQNACKNPGYFNGSRPINKLSSWEGYYYEEGETIYQTNISLSNSNPSCASGSVTATIYTYRKDKDTSGAWTDWYLYSGATPSLSDNTDWLSVGSVANTGTGTYSASVSYSCNCKTTSTRNCIISVSANGTSASASLTQGADSYSDSGGGTTYEYGSWGGGAISFNSTSNLSCGDDSRTVTIQPWTRSATTIVAPTYRDWVCGGRETISEGSRSSWTDWYTGWVSLSENHDYTSLNSTGYYATSNAASVTLSKSSYGCNYADASSVTIYASGATNTSNSLEINANGYSDSGGGVSYGSWSGGAISFDSTSDMSCGTDSRTVTIQPWSRTATKAATIRTYCSGCQQTIANESSWTDYYTSSVSVSENGSYTSLSETSYTASSSAKTITLSKSSCGADPISRTYVTVSASGATNTSNGLYHAANSGTTETDTGYQIASLTLSSSSGDNYQGTFTANTKVQKRTRTRTNYCSGSSSAWSSWSGWSNLSGVKPSISSNVSWISVGSIGSTNSSGVSSTTCTYYENTGGSRSGVITASYGGSSATATFSQESAPNIGIIPESTCSNGWMNYEISIGDTVIASGGGQNSETWITESINWNSLPTNISYWPVSIYFDDYNTLGCQSSNYTVAFLLYDCSGNMIDSSNDISGSCGETLDATIEWMSGRDTNSNIAKMEIRVNFS